jgi:ABC-type multidrug transport system fused ATPase/permease subunit
MTAVERLAQFLNLPEEAPLVVTDVRPPEDWPLHGRVVIRDLRVRYRPALDLILRGVSLTIEPGTKVGICGRTVGSWVIRNLRTCGVDRAC